MRLLFDQNLSRRLVRSLASTYPGSSHVSTLGLEQADDRTIWDYAKQQGFAIVSKDTDLHQFCFLYGPPPKVIWIRLGNCTTARVESLLRTRFAEVRAFEADADAALLVLP